VRKDRTVARSVPAHTRSFCWSTARHRTAPGTVLVPETGNVPVLMLTSWTSPPILPMTTRLLLPGKNLQEARPWRQVEWTWRRSFPSDRCHRHKLPSIEQLTTSSLLTEMSKSVTPREWPFRVSSTDGGSELSRYTDRLPSKEDAMSVLLSLWANMR